MEILRRFKYSGICTICKDIIKVDKINKTEDLLYIYPCNCGYKTTIPCTNPLHE